MKKTFTSLISLLLAVSISLNSSQAFGLPVRAAASRPIFTEEALEVRDIETGTFTRSMRAKQLHQEAAAEPAASSSRSEGIGRRAMLRRAFGATAVAAGIAATAALAQTTPPQDDGYAAIEAELNQIHGQFVEARKQKLPFAEVPSDRPYRQGETARILHLVLGYGAKVIAEKTADGQPNSQTTYTSSEQFLNLQRQLWDNLRRNVQDSELRAILALPFTSAAFAELLFSGLPRYLAARGIYPLYETLSLADERDRVGLILYVPQFYEIQGFESPDFGDDLAKELTSLPVQPGSVVMIGDQIQPDLTTTRDPSWSAQHAYQAVAVNIGYHQNNGAGWLRMVEDALQNTGVTLGQGKVLRVAHDIPALVHAIESGQVSVKAAARQTFQVEVVSQKQELIETALKQKEDPVAALALRDQIQSERQGAAHWLDEFDPQQKLALATAHSEGGSMADFRNGVYNASFHFEMNTALYGLRYGFPVDGLTAVVQQPLFGDTGASGKETSTDAQRDGQTEVFNHLMDQLERDWAERFGIVFVDSRIVSRRDQILIQLGVLAQPQNEKTLHALADLLIAEHVTSYSRHFIPSDASSPVAAISTARSSVTKDVLSVGIAAGAGAAAFLTFEHFLLRKPLLEVVSAARSDPTNPDAMFKATIANPTLKRGDWTFVRTGLTTGIFTKRRATGELKSQRLESNVLLSMARQFKQIDQMFNRLYSVLWMGSILWTLRSLVSILTIKEMIIFLPFPFVFSIIGIVFGFHLFPLMRHARVPFVITGVYQHSRNPIYIAQRLVDVSFIIISIVNGLWPNVFAFLIVFLVNRRLVAWEETRMMLNQGKAYQDYKNRVPRWLGLSSFKKSAVALGLGAILMTGFFAPSASHPVSRVHLISA